MPAFVNRASPAGRDITKKKVVWKLPDHFLIGRNTGSISEHRKDLSDLTAKHKSGPDHVPRRGSRMRRCTKAMQTHSRAAGSGRSQS